MEKVIEFPGGPLQELHWMMLPVSIRPSMVNSSKYNGKYNMRFLHLMLMLVENGIQSGLITEWYTIVSDKDVLELLFIQQRVRRRLGVSFGILGPQGVWEHLMGGAIIHLPVFDECPRFPVMSFGWVFVG